MSAVPDGGDPVLRLAAASPAELAARLDVPDEALLATAAPAPGADAAPADDPAGRCRLAVVGPTPKSLALARRVVNSGRPWRGRNDVWFSPRPLLAAPDGHDSRHDPRHADGGGSRGRVAFLFPGLEAELAPRLDDVARWLGTPVPAVDTSSIGSHAASALRVGRLLDGALRRLGIRPDMVAGHSVGEWNAMAAGGIFSSDELDAMIATADLDAMAVPDVDFGVIGCPVERVAQRLPTAPGVVVSHDNSAHQTVVCGPGAAVGRLIDAFRADGVICQVLPFRSGFHTPMLEPQLPDFRRGLAALDLRPAAIPVWSAATAAPFPDDPATIEAWSVRHLVEPVRFRELVLDMYDAGARVFVQAGAGQLASLVSDTLRGHEHLCVAANSAHRSGLDQLRRVAAALWVEGARPHAVPGAVAVAPAAVAPPVAASAREPADAFAQLAALAERSHLGAELAQLLTELTQLATTVVSSVSAREATAGTTAAAADGTPEVLHVSTAAMPYLRDHCFVPQPPGWPDETDRRPVVPATTVLAHLLEAARRRTGRTPVGADDVVLSRWLVASPPVDVPVETGPARPGRLRVALGPYASAEVVLDDASTATPDGVTHDLTPWPPEPDTRPPTLGPAEIYARRWLFHGPRFQVLHAIHAVGATTVRADLLVTDVPGALLDGVGQVLGVWLRETVPESWLAFPVRLRSIRYPAPVPPAGTVVRCTLRIRATSALEVEADAQVEHGGVVFLSVRGWVDRFFDCAGADGDTYRFPETHTVADLRPDGTFSAREPWRDLATRELWLHRYLGRAERAAYEACPPRERRTFLLGCIAVKDAVRTLMWADGEGPVFPVELTVRPGPTGWTVAAAGARPVPRIGVGVTTTADGVLVRLDDAATRRLESHRPLVAKELTP